VAFGVAGLSKIANYRVIVCFEQVDEFNILAMSRTAQLSKSEAL
jgi:hypothetical protein